MNVLSVQGLQRNIKMAPEAADTAAVRADKSADTAKKDTDRTAARAEDSASEKVYGNILDISEDGDTVTARPEAMQALADGYVMLKTGSADTAADRMDTKEADEAVTVTQTTASVSGTDPRYSTLTGYSEQQIEILYDQGKISRQDYQNELDRRERLAEEMGTTDADETAQTIEQDRAGAQELGSINAEAEQKSLRAEALETALDNNRSALMTDIFASQTAQ